MGLFKKIFLSFNGVLLSVWIQGCGGGFNAKLESGSDLLSINQSILSSGSTDVGVGVEDIEKEISSASLGLPGADEIITFYQDHLGRNPDLAGFAHYLTQHANGRSLEDIEEEILNSPEAQVREVYLTELKREPDLAGLRHYVRLLMTGWDIDRVREDISNSDEAFEISGEVRSSRLATEEIRKFYRMYLLREPDVEGFNHYMNQVRRGRSLADIENEIANSDEAKTVQITSFYRDFLGREPDAPGLRHYLNQAKNGRSLRSIASEIANSQEAFLRKFNVAAAERQIREFYRASLGREPDVGGFNYYMNQARNRRPLAEIGAEIANSPEAKIRSFYLKHLKREPDAGGLRHYMNQAKSGRALSTIESEIAHSQEAFLLTFDQARAEREIRGFYRASLGREPDAGGFSHYVNQARNKRSLADIGREIANSPEAKIRGFYLKHLKREPDAGGLRHYLNQNKIGRSLSAIETEIANSEEAKDLRFDKAGAERAIRGFYRTSLGRAPDTGGFNHYMKQARDGRSLSSIGSEIANSPEANIRRFYLKHLKREPDAGGLRHYLNQNKIGRSLSSIEAEIASSPEARNLRFDRAGAERAIRGFYSASLGRAPDSGGFNHYMNQARDGRSLSSIGSEIANSPEANIRRFYLKHLKREPDAGGLAHYLNQNRFGRSLSAIENEIANSPEAQRVNFDASSVAAKIRGFYRRHLGRSPDNGGFDHYMNQARSGRSLGDIEREIANSPEAKIRGFYLTSLKREPDAGGMAHYLNQHKNGRPLLFIQIEIANSPEARSLQF